MVDEKGKALAKRCLVSSMIGWTFFAIFGALQLLDVPFVRDEDNIVLVILGFPFAALWAHGVYVSFISTLVTEYRTTRLVYVAAVNAVLFAALVLFAYFATK